MLVDSVSRGSASRMWCAHLLQLLRGGIRGGVHAIHAHAAAVRLASLRQERHQRNSVWKTVTRLAGSCSLNSTS